MILLSHQCNLHKSSIQLMWLIFFATIQPAHILNWFCCPFCSVRSWLLTPCLMRCLMRNWPQTRQRSCWSRLPRRGRRSTGTRAAHSGQYSAGGSLQGKLPLPAEKGPGPRILLPLSCPRCGVEKSCVMLWEWDAVGSCVML